jgi:hypothetical protein
MRKNETTWFEGKWMQLEDIILSEESQAQKDKACIFLSYEGDRHNRNISNIMKKSLHQGEVTNRRGRVKEGG